MKNVSRVMLIVAAVAVVGLAVFLATWDIPAPTAKVEKVIPDERFPR
jgi:hypothetical protein